MTELWCWGNCPLKLPGGLPEEITSAQDKSEFKGRGGSGHSRGARGWVGSGETRHPGRDKVLEGLWAALSSLVFIQRRCWEL